MDKLKTPGEFLKWFRQNISRLNISHEDIKFSQFCGLLIKGQIELGEIDLEENDRFWECLRSNDFRRMPNTEEWKIIKKEGSKGIFLN